MEHLVLVVIGHGTACLRLGVADLGLGLDHLGLDTISVCICICSLNGTLLYNRLISICNRYTAYGRQIGGICRCVDVV